MDRNVVSKNWADRGFSCDVWSDAPGTVWRDYVHNVDELAMLIEGEVEFVIDGKIHRPKIDEELFIPRNVKHTVTNIGKVRNRWFYGYRRACG